MVDRTLDTPDGEFQLDVQNVDEPYDWYTLYRFDSWSDARKVQDQLAVENPDSLYRVRYARLDDALEAADQIP